MDTPFTYHIDQFADIEVLRYRVPGFEQLSLQQKLLIYHLSEAALSGRDILYDQNYRYNLRIRRALEQAYTHYTGDRETADFHAFETYLKRVWFSNGIHHHYSTHKFVPDCSPAYFQQVLQAGGIAPEEAHRLSECLYDTEKDAKRVNLAEGEDLLLTSASNYYRQVTQAEAEAFYAAKVQENPAEPVSYGMNSRLEKDDDGHLQEIIWSMNGEYAPAIRRIVGHLLQAATYAENPAQQQVINTLVDFYRTGDLKTFDRYSILWIQDTLSRVDFVNGFIETYGDPLGIKASWEGIVNFRDEEATHRTEIISQHAQWFEDHSPVDSSFRKKQVKGVSAKVIINAMLGGDCYPATPIGINLPNANWIRQVYGSKSVTISNIMQAYDQASQGNGFAEEFYLTEADRQAWYRYGYLTDMLHTDLHECLGHGSGQLLPGVSQEALKAYGATLEEARADLFALYYLGDAKLVELGLLPDSTAYQAAYYHYLLNGLMTQLVRIPLGEQVEESHMRNRQLIAAWVFERAQAQGAADWLQQDGKTYLSITDYRTLHQLFGELLKEVQRIKSEGDYEAGRQLVETYGIVPDASRHQEVLTRYAQLHIAPYRGFVNPRYRLVKNADGSITDVVPEYTESFSEQMLRYSRDYSFLP